MAFDPTDKFAQFLSRNGLVLPSEKPLFQPLPGGVSSDIWRVDCARGPICIKAALGKLKVDADWYAPIERNRYEIAWLKKANQIVPGIAPEILAEDDQNGLFAMTYLPPETYPNWKTLLKDGRVDPAVASDIGASMALIHRRTMNDDETARAFQTDAIFHAIRLEPYLEATAARHPEIAPVLLSISRDTANTRQALVHGDISPKNILVGPDGPKILDAECAWYGDPAFDLAFCLNHLLLKCLWKREFTDRYLSCYDALVLAYDAALDGSFADIEGRAARLLPGLMLGRIDGRSPVEYLTHDQDKNHVRRVATELLKNPVTKLADLRQHWHKDLTR